MTSILADFYLWVKALHVMAVLAWMAGLFYLPRLFVYHAEQIKAGEKADALFQTMEMKLLRVIMNPAMIVAWICGLLLVATPGIVDWSAVWPWTKGFGVIAMTVFHVWLTRRLKGFQAGENTHTGKQYRIMNEVPTLLMIVIVFSVTVKF